MKTKILLLLFFPCYLFAQAVVSAPVLEKTAFKELGETLKLTAEATKQTQELKQSYNLLKDTYDAIEKVSSQVKGIKTVNKILKSQTSVIKKANTIHNKTYDLAKIDQARGKQNRKPQIFRDAVSQIVDDSYDYIEMLKMLTTTGQFKMNDYERINFIFKIESKIRHTHSKLDRIEQELDKQIGSSTYLKSRGN